MVKAKLYLGFVFLSMITLLTGSFAGCVEVESSEGAISCYECLKNPVYDKEITLYGTVSSLGKLGEPTFILTSGGKELVVRYALMIEEDETERPAVNIAGIKNGDRVIVTGELKREGKHSSLNDFWAKYIKKY